MTGTDQPPGSGATPPRAPDVEAALGRLFDRFVAANGADGLLERPWEADWLSPCQVGGVDDRGRIRWQPTRQQPPGGFANLERALETRIHPDIAAFFGSWWCDHVPVEAYGLDCDLLFVWNADDLEMLQANLIGHALEKRRVREPLTVFFAPVDDYRFFSVDNDSGTVMLETLGRRGPVPAADTLARFLDSAVCRDYGAEQGQTQDAP